MKWETPSSNDWNENIWEPPRAIHNNSFMSLPLPHQHHFHIITRSRHDHFHITTFTLNCFAVECCKLFCVLQLGETWSSGTVACDMPAILGLLHFSNHRALVGRLGRANIALAARTSRKRDVKRKGCQKKEMSRARDVSRKRTEEEDIQEKDMVSKGVKSNRSQEKESSKSSKKTPRERLVKRMRCEEKEVPRDRAVKPRDRDYNCHVLSLQVTDPKLCTTDLNRIPWSGPGFSNWATARRVP